MGKKRSAQKHPPARRSSPLRLRKPLILKLIVVLMGLTVAAGWWQGYRDYHLTSSRMDKLKNEDGVKFVCYLSLFIPPFWLTTTADGQTVKADRASIKSNKEAIEAKLKKLTSHEAGRNVLDIVVFSETETDKNTFYASLSQAGSFSWTQEKDALSVPFAEEAGVVIHQGRQNDIPVRSFTAPILKDGNPVGRVVVYLSAKDLESARLSLRREIVRNVVLFLLMAGGISVLLGLFLTRPIRQLATDMRAVSNGDLDRRSTVHSADEVGDLAHTFNRMVASLKEVQERRATQKAMEKELGIARRIQKGLLPATLPQIPRWDVAAYWTPAKEVGGDYYDFIPLGDGAWGTAVGDVSGKGIPASLIMSMVRCLLRLATRAGLGPAGTLGLVNDVITPDLKDGMFISMVFLHFTEDRGAVRLVRAGHNPPIVLPGGDASPKLCEIPGVALGLRSGFGHQGYAETELPLNPGDALILYSDGIVEAMNEQGEEFEMKRFLKTLAAVKHQSARDIIKASMVQLTHWRGKAAQSDDITLVVLKRKK